MTISVATLPSIWESLYWQTGSITYLLPIVFGTAYVATVWRTLEVWQYWRARATWLAAGLLFIMLGIGCSETAMAMLVCGLALGWLALALFHHGPQRKALLKVVGVAVFVALCAAVVVILAPGNAARSTYFDHPPLGLALIETIWFPCLALFNLLVHAPIYTVLAYAVPFVLARQTLQVLNLPATEHLLRTRRLVMLGGALLIAGSGAPAFYVGGAAPPARAQIITQFVLIACLMTCGLLDGLARRHTSPAMSPARWQRASRALATVGLIIGGPIITTTQTFASANELQAYAAGRDQMDRDARQAATTGDWSPSVRRVLAPAIVGVEDIGPDRAAPANVCVAAYYGLHSIRSDDSGE